ncbi:MAG: ankyrin repeat domain-containing protein [Lachnospiraceae bacterium]|nr:ankyrin repeat domain-containing protein [Lachnospiraceae bacterium]
MKKDSYSDRLYKAICSQDTEAFDALLQEGGDVNSLRDEEQIATTGIFRMAKSSMDLENVYPLQIACQKSPEMAYKLLAAGAKVDVVDAYLHSTPLIYALSSNQPDRFTLASELLKRGADPGRIDDNKRVAINNAVHTLRTDSEETRQQSMELLKELLAKTDMQDVIDNSASNPLREAAKYGNCEAIEYLLSQEIIDIDLVTDGMTPLMIAVIGKNTQACKMLLEKGADPSIVSREGKTAYDYAKEYNNEELLQVFAQK